MKVAAHTVEPGDIVRGVGLLVDDVDPLTDFTTRLYGTVSQWDDNEGEEGGYVKTPAIIEVPNAHRLNIRRSDEGFRNDRIAMVAAALDARQKAEEAEAPADEATAALYHTLGQVATMPRGRRYAVTTESVLAYTHHILSEGIGNYTAEQIVTDLDSLDTDDDGDGEGSDGGLMLVVLN